MQSIVERKTNDEIFAELISKLSSKAIAELSEVVDVKESVLEGALNKMGVDTKDDIELQAIESESAKEYLVKLYKMHLANQRKGKAHRTNWRVAIKPSSNDLETEYEKMQTIKIIKVISTGVRN